MAESTTPLWAELPTREKAKAWEDQVAGASAIMFREVRKQIKHKRRRAWAEVAVQTFEVLMRGLPVLCAFGVSIAMVWLAKYYVDHKAPTQGATIVGTSLAAVVAAFIGTKVVESRKGGAAEPNPNETEP